MLLPEGPFISRVVPVVVTSTLLESCTTCESRRRPGRATAKGRGHTEQDGMCSGWREERRETQTSQINLLLGSPTRTRARARRRPAAGICLAGPRRQGQAMRSRDLWSVTSILSILPASRASPAPGFRDRTEVTSRLRVAPRAWRPRTRTRRTGANPKAVRGWKGNEKRVARKVLAARGGARRESGMEGEENEKRSTCRSFFLPHLFAPR